MLHYPKFAVRVSAVCRKMSDSKDGEVARTEDINIANAPNAIPNDLERGATEANRLPVEPWDDSSHILRCFDITADGGYQAVEGQWTEKDLVQLKKTSPEGQIRLVLAQHEFNVMGDVWGDDPYHPDHVLSLLNFAAMLPQGFELLSFEECWDRPHFRHFLRAPSTGFSSLRHCVSVVHVIDGPNHPLGQPAAPAAMMISWIPSGDDRLLSKLFTCILATSH